jgi:hypothetical protein
VFCFRRCIFCNFCSPFGFATEQVEACWQWHNYFVNTCPVGKTTLTINIDETYVNFFQGIYKGNLAVGTRDLPPDAQPLTQHATRSQLRSGLTHVGVICDVPVVQPLLPQILIAPKNVLTVRDLGAVRAAMPQPIYVVHKKSKWVNVKILVWLMKMIHWSLRHVRSLYNVVIMLDVLAVHFTPELLQCMDTLSFKYMFVPARLTWLIQPCDTHCFALYKRYLKLRVLRYRARNPLSTVPAVPVWFGFIADTIVNLMNQRSWVAAFRENGFGDSQMQVSDYIKRYLVSTTMLPISAFVPGVDILHAIFPSNRTNLPFPFFASPVEPLAIAGVGGHAHRVAGMHNMVNGHTNVRPAMPINLDAIVVRVPRPKAKAKAKS